MLIEQYAYSSAIKDIDPRVKLYFSMIFLLLTLLTHENTILLVIFIIMIGSSRILGKIPLMVFLKLLLLPITFLSVGVLGIIINYGHTPTPFLASISFLKGYLGVTNESISQGTFVFFKALTGTACMYFLILNTPMIDLISALRKLKLPSVLLVLMELTYRFIFIVMDTANGIYVAQKSRLGYSTYKKSYTNLGKLASVLLIRSFLRIDDLFRALEARGYTGEINVLDDGYNAFTIGYVISTLMAISLLLVEWLK